MRSQNHHLKSPYQNFSIQVRIHALWRFQCGSLPLLNILNTFWKQTVLIKHRREYVSLACMISSLSINPQKDSEEMLKDKEAKAEFLSVLLGEEKWEGLVAGCKHQGFGGLIWINTIILSRITERFAKCPTSMYVRSSRWWFLFKLC